MTYILSVSLKNNAWQAGENSVHFTTWNYKAYSNCWVIHQIPERHSAQTE